MIKAYSYIRFSTPAQAQGDSLRRQIAKAEAWAKERGLVLDNTLRDLGVSAFHGANRTKGALRAFLDMVESGKVEAGSFLIVESLDRISREAVLDAAQQLFALIQANIIVVTLDDNQEYSAERLRNDWTPLVISLAVMSRAHDESKQKSIRVGDIWREKKRSARDDGKPVTSRCPEWLKVQGDKFIPRADRVAVVRTIFDYTIAGYGRREIVRRLNDEAVPTFRGGDGWQTSSIAKIQQSRAVLGEYQPHRGAHRNRDRQPDGEPIKDYYPRVIDEVTFWRAQKAIAERRHQSSGRRGVDGAHILRGLAKCEICGGPMHIVNKGRPPKGGVYLCCSSNRRKAGCENGRAWRVDRLEIGVLKSVGSLDVTAFAMIHGVTPKALKLVDSLKAEVSQLETSRDRLLSVVETGDDAAVVRFREVAENIKAKRQELKSAEAEAAKIASDPGIVKTLIEASSLANKLQAADEDERRDLRIRLSAILRTVIDQIICGPNTGAVMVVKQRPEWSINLTGFAVRMEPEAIYVLLDNEAPKAVVDHFLTDFSADAD